MGYIGSITHYEWATISVSAERMLWLDELLRMEGFTFFKKNRELVEKLRGRVEDLPMKSRSGLKALCSRMEIKAPNWLDNPKSLPPKMSIKLSSDDWFALEVLLCNTVTLHNREGKLERPWLKGFLSSKGYEIAKKLLNRILLLPRKSRAAQKALLTRVGAKVELKQLDDYRDLVYHLGSQLIEPLGEE